MQNYIHRSWHRALARSLLSSSLFYFGSTTSLSYPTCLKEDNPRSEINSAFQQQQHVSTRKASFTKNLETTSLYINTTTSFLFTRCRELVELREHILYSITSRGPDPPVSPPNQERRGAPLHPLNTLPPNRSMLRLECSREATSRALHHRGWFLGKMQEKHHSHFSHFTLSTSPSPGKCTRLPIKHWGRTEQLYIDLQRRIRECHVG